MPRFTVPVALAAVTAILTIAAVGWGRPIEKAKHDTPPTMTLVAKSSEAAVHVTTPKQEDDPERASALRMYMVSQTHHMLHTDLKTGQMQALVFSSSGCDIRRRRYCYTTRLLGYAAGDAHVFALVWRGGSYDRPPEPKFGIGVPHGSRYEENCELVAFDTRTGMRLAGISLDDEQMAALPRRLKSNAPIDLPVVERAVRVAGHAFELVDDKWSVRKLDESDGGSGDATE